jgi:hypothetical protein
MDRKKSVDEVAKDADDENRKGEAGAEKKRDEPIISFM